MMPSIISIDEAWLIELIDKRFAEHGLIKEPECQHETDGEIYIIDSFKGAQERFKCIKCGEFYK